MEESPERFKKRMINKANTKRIKLNKTTHDFVVWMGHSEITVCSVEKEKHTLKWIRDHYPSKSGTAWQSTGKRPSVCTEKSQHKHYMFSC